MDRDHLRLAQLLFLVAVFSGYALDSPRAQIGSAVPSPALPATTGGPAKATPAPPRAWTAGLPVLFEPNVGQMDRRTRFLSRGPGYSLFLTDAALLVTVPVGTPGAKPVPPRAPGAPQGQAVLRIDFVGQARTPRIEGEDRLKTVIHSHIGNDRSKWRTDIPTYGRVVYRDLYPGIDMAVRGGTGGPAYDFVVAPRAEPARILMRFPGAERLSIDKAGNLISRIAGRDIRHSAPALYQEISGKRTPVTGRYELRDKNQVGFRVGRYDRTRPLIIDPTLAFATVAGGSGDDSLYGLAVDDGGNAYAVGQTFSGDLPPLNSTRTVTAGHSDAFLIKLRGSDGTPEYVTFFGGNGTERAAAVAVTGTGEAYITGHTHSPDFPTTPGAAQPVLVSAGDPQAFIHADAFMARFDTAGHLGASTFLGGSLAEFGNAIALHPTGVFVAGGTYSDDLRPADLPSAYQTQRAGAFDAFVTKLSLDLTAILYSTYLGGSDGAGLYERASGIAVNGNGEAHVVGWTHSTSNFPTHAGAGIPVRSPGSGDEAFVVKLNAAGTALIYSTLLGGSLGSSTQEFANGVALDSNNNAHVVGQTSVTDFQPLQPPQALQEHLGGVQDGFLTKLDPDGRVLFSTYLGGASGDVVTAVTTTADKVWVAGTSYQAPSYVQPENTVAASPTGWGDAFAAALAADGSAMTYWRFFGGSHLDRAMAVAATASGDVYVAGTTHSGDFPNSGTTYGPRGGAPDIFVAKLTTGVATPPQLSIATTATPQPTIHVGDNVTLSIKVRNAGTVPLAGAGLSVDFAGGPAIALTGWDTRCAPSPGASAVAAATIACTLGPGSSGTIGIGGEDTIELRGQAVGPGAADNVAIATATGAAPASSRTTWTVLPREPVRRELSVAVTPSPDPIRAGDTVTLSVSVGNSGNVPLTNLRLSNNFIGGSAMQLTGWAQSCIPQPGASPIATVIVDCSTLGTIPGTLGVNETATVTFTGPAVAPGQVTDIATATADSTATAQSVLTRTVLSGPADLGLEMQIYDLPEVGVRLSPLVILFNHGPQPASSVLIRVTIAGTAAIENQPSLCATVATPIGSPQALDCSFPGPYAAASGAAATAFIFDLRPTAPGTLTICASITQSSADDAVDTNNSTCQDVVVPAPIIVPTEPGLSITNQASLAAIHVGERFAFKTGVTNIGNVPLTNAQFQDTFTGSRRLAFEGFEADPHVLCGSLTTDGSGRTRISCTVEGALAPGESRGIRIGARAIARGAVTSTVIALTNETGPIWMISVASYQIQQ